MSSKFPFLESMEILTTIPLFYHTFLLAFIVSWTTWYFAKKRYQNSNSDDFDARLEQWRPEPLIPEVPENHPSLNPRKIMSKIGKRIIVDGRDCLNVGTHNYLDLADNLEIELKAIETVKKYGVGSCGPRGFYGTVDVHLELEERLAKFMEMEEAVVYSYGFSTIASAIPAFCKRNDIIFVDEKVNFAIQKGLDASRSTIKWFRHNCIADLDRKMTAELGPYERDVKKVDKTRKFLIIEGIYMNTGNLCPLPSMVDLCKRHRVRIFIDESISFGTMGANGRGVTEHFNVPRHKIDMIMGK